MLKRFVTLPDGHIDEETLIGDVWAITKCSLEYDYSSFPLNIATGQTEVIKFEDWHTTQRED